MSLEGQQITAVRDLTPEDVSILGPFPAARDTIPGLELESGEVIFISGDEEGNLPGEWPMGRDELEELVGQYILGFRGPANHSGPHATRPPVVMDVAPELPDGPMAENEVFDRESVDNITTITPMGRGSGPSAWFIREPVDEDTRPDPEQTPTPREVMDMRVEGDLDDIDEYNDLLSKAERAHNDAVFSSIC